jgi:hypothetical protein
MGCLRIVSLHPTLSASLVILLLFALGLLSAQAQAPSLLNKMRALDVPGATVPAHHISSLRIPVAQGLRSEVLQSLVRPRRVTLGISFQVVRVHHDRVSHSHAPVSFQARASLRHRRPLDKLSSLGTDTGGPHPTTATIHCSSPRWTEDP